MHWHWTKITNETVEKVVGTCLINVKSNAEEKLTLKNKFLLFDMKRMHEIF